ncbi:MAG: TatD family hydrolase [Burkholderiaceae bacterium]|jgi:hypothetical protein|nr:TatD family hydrolase [Burkholderiaceae bacterium]
MRRRHLLAATAALPLAAAMPRAALAASPPALPIFDAHMHYSHDAWDVLPPQAALALLHEAGVVRALVSSSGDGDAQRGQQRLAQLAPGLVLPSLRPYRQRGDQNTWFADDAIIGYLDDRLAQYRYVALGEFHVFGADVDRPVPRHLVQLARRHALVLHSHSDAEAIERQFVQWPQARVLWAHAGFERPERVRQMLARYPQLWCDLAFRSEHAPGGQLDDDWKALFLAYPDRFMVGTDTFTPERWPYVVEHARWCRQWLAQLPAAVAANIAHRNGEALFAAAARRLQAR